jgi:hypothetical protein
LTKKSKNGNLNYKGVLMNNTVEVDLTIKESLITETDKLKTAVEALEKIAKNPFKQTGLGASNIAKSALKLIKASTK